MSSVKATQLRPGMVIQHEGQLFTVFSTEHRTPGNKRGSMQTRMKNLKTGAIIDYRFRAEEFIERAILDEIEFEYLYNDGDNFHFMNTQTYEQMHLTREQLGETVYYLIPNTVVSVEFFDNKPIGVALPDTMDLKVTQTEPTLQKATASAVMKPATLETGLVVQVPPFVNEGATVKTGAPFFLPRNFVESWSLPAGKLLTRLKSSCQIPQPTFRREDADRIHGRRWRPRNEAGDGDRMCAPELSHRGILQFAYRRQRARESSCLFPKPPWRFPARPYRHRRAACRLPRGLAATGPKKRGRAWIPGFATCARGTRASGPRW